MADVYEPQSTDRLPGDTSPDTYRVLFRGSLTINSTDYTLTGSWYQVTKSIDLGQFSFVGFPMVEFYLSDQISPQATLYKGPALVTSSSGALTRNFSCYLTTGVKSSNTSTQVNFVIGGTSNTDYILNYQIMSLPAGGSLF